MICIATLLKSKILYNSLNVVVDTLKYKVLLAVRVFNSIKVPEMKFVRPKTKFDLNKNASDSEKQEQFCPSSGCTGA